MDHVGMDLGKKVSQIAILTDDGEVIDLRVRTERHRLVEVFAQRPAAKILVEASTESEWVARCLEGLGHEVIVADPNYAPMYAQRSRRVKTDRRDARALAQACKLGAYRPAHRISDARHHLRSLLGVREAIVRARARWRERHAEPGGSAVMEVVRRGRVAPPLTGGMLLPIAAAVCGLFAAITSIAQAERAFSVADGGSGRIEFRSVTPDGPTQLVRRSYPSEGTVVVGDLTLPPHATGRVPAMVIAHGSGGALPGREDAWARRLNAVGIATFVVDSFGPRGLKSTAMAQSQLSTMANLADSLSALRLLATHPRIDPAQIGVIGFSRGGQVALYSTLEPLRRSVIDDELRFAAHVALYPSCSIPYRAKQVTGAPILMLLGAADDYTPPHFCRSYAEWFRERGAPVRILEYAGAYHDFDIPEPPRFLRGLQSARGCNAEVDVEIGTMRRMDTGEALRGPAVSEYLRACTQRGATIGGNAAALAQAERDVIGFLSKTFGVNR